MSSRRFEGHVGNYIGDGILAYFGYPVAHEDDALRAIRAGLDIVDAIKRLDGELETFGVSVDVRVGINTGLVVVGDIGTGEFRDEMAVVGETPNVAARLQGLAEPGTVVVGERTQRLVEGLFTFDGARARTHQRDRRSRSRYTACARRPRVGSLRGDARRGLTPLVGRDEEIQLLLSRWEGAKAGEGPRRPADRRARHRQVAHHAGVSRSCARRGGGGAALLLFAVLRPQRPAPRPRPAGARRRSQEGRSAGGQARQARGAAQPGLPRVPTRRRCSRRCCRSRPASATRRSRSRPSARSP